MKAGLASELFCRAIHETQALQWIHAAIVNAADRELA
jgi:hypothetical protein